ncbi:hypothetical protein L209DRAFT_529656 [Thermothelomyces heterothallicus CBS 203.75]
MLTYDAATTHPAMLQLRFSVAPFSNRRRCRSTSATPTESTKLPKFLYPFFKLTREYSCQQNRQVRGLPVVVYLFLDSPLRTVRTRRCDHLPGKRGKRHFKALPGPMLTLTDSFSFLTAVTGPNTNCKESFQIQSLTYLSCVSSADCDYKPFSRHDEICVEPSSFHSSLEVELLVRETVTNMAALQHSLQVSSWLSAHCLS